MSTNKINLLDLAAACVACTETASTAIQKIASPIAVVVPEAEGAAAEDTTTTTTTTTSNTNGGEMDASSRSNNTTDQKNTRLKPDGSFVTDADFVAQGVIVQAVRTVSTEIRIVGEESAEEMAAHVGAHAFLDEAVLQRTAHELRLRYHSSNSRVLASATPSSETATTEEEDTSSTRNSLDLDTVQLPLAQGIKPSDPLDPALTELLNQYTNNSNEDDCWVEASRVGVIVDPLDGTKSYAHGEYDAVSILICITLDDQPYFGVIGKPFGYLPEAQLTSMLDTSCVTIYGGPLLKGVYVAGGKTLRPTPLSREPDQLPRAVISGSRSKGIVHDFCVHLGELGWIDKEPMLISGAGEKSLRLILQINNEALWFFPKSGTSLWDVAAPDALLRSLGGKLTDKFGNAMDYTKPRAEAENMEGVVACIDADLHAQCIQLFSQDNWVERR